MIECEAHSGSAARGRGSSPSTSGRDPFGKRRRRYVTVRGTKAPAQRIEDDPNGGAAHIWSNGSLEPDTLYKYTLMLMNEFGMTVIEKTRIER